MPTREPPRAGRLFKGLIGPQTALCGGTDANPAYEWAVDVNNPTDQAITTTLQRNMDLPGFVFSTQEIILGPGEHRVVYGPDPAVARAY